MCQSTTVMDIDIEGNATFDSVFLSLMEQENNCSCNVSVKNVKTDINLNIKRLNNLTEQSLCGMEIDIYYIRTDETVLPENIPTKCNSLEHNITLSLFKNEYLQFTSRVLNESLPIRYCIQLERVHKKGEEESYLEILCGRHALTNKTDTPTHPQTTHIQDKTDYNGDSTLYIAVGAGGGFVLLVSLLVVILLCKRRKSHLSVKEENNTNHIDTAATDDEDDDALKYNVMYVSSERHDNIDVNYSTVDGDIPRHIGGDDECDYSTVDDNKNIQDSSLNTRQFTNTASEVREDDGTEHINTPTGSGCVYAVVDKSHKTKKSVTNIETASKSAVYAVVDKNRVRHPEEGT